MTYTIKRLREEGHFCLSSLDAVESLDVFWAEATKVARLYIEDTNVYVAPTKTKRSEGEFEGLACRRDNNYKTRLVFVSKPTDIDSLRSVAFRILCLPETNPQSMKLDGIDYLPSKPGDRYKQLFFTTEQLRHIICAHPSRQYTFSRFSLTGAQSVEIVSHRKFAIGVNWCQFDDKGQAIVDWLEDRNEKEIIDSCYFPQCDCVEKLFTFLSRSLYPVFNKLYLTGKDVESKSSLSPLIAAANVNTLMVDIKFFLCNEGWRAPLLKALQNGTFRPRNLEVNFSSNDLFGFDEDDLRLISKFLSKFFEAISSPDCSVKELHLKHIDDDYTNISRTMESYLLYMMQNNRSLRVLGIYSEVAPLVFPQMRILKAAAKHPRLRKICFYPPTSYDPPEVGQDEPFQLWAQKNRAHNIHFKDFGHPDKKPHLSKWQKAFFSVFSREFDVLKQVEDERIRSHLLVTALATFCQMPDRVYYLLTANQDAYAR